MSVYSRISRRLRRLSQSVRHTFRSNPQLFWICFTMVTCLVFMSAAYIPTTYVFEGIVSASEVGFLNTDNNQLFLNDIYGVRLLSVKGRQSLVLQGEFTSNDLDSSPYVGILDIDLDDDDSQFIINPTDPKISELSIDSLYLGKDVSVNGLSYSHLLERNLDFKMNPSSSSNLPTASLDLSLGRQPLMLELRNYKLPNLSLEGEIMELQFIPSVPTLNSLSLIGEVTVSINMPDPLNESSVDWFWGGISVSKLRFNKQRLTRKVDDRRIDSTISSGFIRTSDITLSLSENQFLLVEGGDFSEISSIRALPSTKDELDNEKYGLEVIFSGSARKIGAGINQDLPVKVIESSWLSKRVSKEGVAAVISFCSAMLINCISWIIDSLKTSSS